MILFFLKYWQPLSAAVLALGLAFGAHKLSVYHIEAKQAVEIAGIKSALAAQCDADKAITTEVSNDYQKSIADLDMAVAAARDRLHECTSIIVQGGSALRHDGTPAGKELAGRGTGGASDATISAGRYIEIASKGERYRLQLKACQSFVLKTTPSGQKPPK